MGNCFFFFCSILVVAVEIESQLYHSWVLFSTTIVTPTCTYCPFIIPIFNKLCNYNKTKMNINLLYLGIYISLKAYWNMFVLESTIDPYWIHLINQQAVCKQLFWLWFGVGHVLPIKGDYFRSCTVFKI